MHTTQNLTHLQNLAAREGRTIDGLLASFTLTTGDGPVDVTVTHERHALDHLFVVRRDGVEVQAFPGTDAEPAARAIAHALEFCGWAHAVAPVLAS